MYIVNELDDKVLSSFKRVDEVEVTKKLDETLRKFNGKIVVLDDDPTGVQTVHDVSVYTDWSKESIAEGFAENNSMFFLLTNSRGLTSEESEEQHIEIAENIERVAKEMGKDYILISRSDSILRGHYPLETATLKEVIESRSDKRFDGEIIYPFLKEGGRFTIENVHYVHYDQRLVPAGETEFAKDKTFGYKSSHLGEWVEEKTKGEFRKEKITYISLEDLRNLKIDKIQEDLMKVEGFNKVVVNAIDYVDVKIFSLILMNAILAGKRFMIRSAAALTKVLGNVSDRELLTKNELTKDNKNGGMVVIGSYTQKTTEQFKELSKLQNIAFIEFNSDLVMDDVALHKEIERVIEACEEKIKHGITVAVYTKRKPLELKTNDKVEALKASIKISDAVTAIVTGITTTPAFILAKGGITSSEIGTKALKVKKAKVMGQIKPGIPVWQTDEESKFSTMPYIIFPGNVGTNTTLREIVALLMD
ncbi:Uncharacterized conserved protein YgbK, DUF1537 family [Anaerovirgula multivorans]|uniref:Uncharacterized conserved protein YgbK, DUF1537 family n=1 Tax=Anaerovirgula multivorans TaxID=312168 RepID=A0A239JNB2_9FIRM|nr:four-carbon acid sugar kinase family protein [Anaerovirgula multivorans]SNT07381.1 Uncharacterized conserved protein YgbK, DUF1537 family [Anaerovirgula multivorans]